MRRARLIAAASLPLLILLAQTNAGAATDDEDTSPTACEQQHVLLLMDESGSLRRTDPDALRVEAASLLIEGLAPSDADRPPVVMTIAGFGSTYEVYGEYRLPDQRPAALAEVEQFEARNTQANTDYVLALREAAQFFAAIDAPTECATLIWFTDGGHDIEFPAQSRAEEYTTTQDAGAITLELEQLVCGPLPDSALISQPVAAAMNDAGFRTVISELESGQLSERERELLDNTHQVLERLVQRPDDACAVPGDLETVSQPAQLASLFLERAQQVLGAHRIGCGLLREGRLRSDVVRSVAFRLDRATPAVLRAGDQSTELSGRIIDRDIPPEARQRGAAISVDTEAELVDCYAGLEAELDFYGGMPPRLFRGASASAVELVVKGPLLEEPVSIGPELVEVVVLADGETIDTSFDSTRGVWTALLPTPTGDSVELEARSSLAGQGAPEIELAQLSRSLEVSQVPPAPLLTWTGGTRLEGSGSITGTIRVSPRVTVEDAENCVTITDQVVPIHAEERSQPIAELQLEESEACGAAEAGSSFDIPATLVATDDLNANGDIIVSFDAEYRFADGTQLQASDVEPANLGRLTLIDTSGPSRRATVFAGFLAAAGLIPLLVLWAANERQGRLDYPGHLAALSVPVQIHRSGSGDDATFTVRRDPAHPVRLEDRQAIDGSSQEWTLPNGLRARRRIPLNPFGTPGSVIDSDRDPIVASIGDIGRRGGVRGPIELEDAVIVSVPPGAPTDPDELLTTEAVLLARRVHRRAALEALFDQGLARCAPKLHEAMRPNQGAVRPDHDAPADDA